MGKKLQNNLPNVQPRAKSTPMNLAKPQFYPEFKDKFVLSAVAPKMVRSKSSDTVQSLRKKTNNRDTGTRKQGFRSKKAFLLKKSVSRSFYLLMKMRTFNGQQKYFTGFTTPQGFGI